MSVDVDALIEHHPAFGTPEALCRVLDATPPFGAPGLPWRADPGEFTSIEEAFAARGPTRVKRDDDRDEALLGRRLTRLPEPEPGLKWYRFCEDTDGEYTRTAGWSGYSRTSRGSAPRRWSGRGSTRSVLRRTSRTASCTRTGTCASA